MVTVATAVWAAIAAARGGAARDDGPSVVRGEAVVGGAGDVVVAAAAENRSDHRSRREARGSDPTEPDDAADQLRWIRSAPCPGAEFGREGGCTRDIRSRAVALGCVVSRCDVEHIRNRWVAFVGDSNMRYLYLSVLGRTNIAAELGGTETPDNDERYRDREATNDELGLRLSYRFVDTRDQSAAAAPARRGVGPNDASSRGEPTKLDRVMADMGRPCSENGTALPTPPPRPAPFAGGGPRDRPDLAVMNTGLWELIRIGEGADDWREARPRLREQFRSLLERWRAEGTSGRLVWMTSPSVRPTDRLRRGRMSKERMRWLAAMETRMIREDFPEVGLIENWAWTEKEGFQDSDYHYYNCSMATLRKLVMGTMCQQLSLPPVYFSFR